MQFSFEFNFKKIAKLNVVYFYISQREFNQQPVIMVDDDLLEEIESTKFLRMYLNRGLTWSDHIDYVFQWKQGSSIPDG